MFRIGLNHLLLAVFWLLKPYKLSIYECVGDLGVLRPAEAVNPLVTEVELLW